ncbi:MAG: efflux transporter periplasmic adaptor subunit, partial [Neisseria elongata]
MKKTVKWIAIPAVALVAAYSVWSYFQPEPQTSYITETVKRGDISQTVSATG